MGEEGKSHPPLTPVPDKNSDNGTGLLQCGCDPSPLKDKAVTSKISPNMFEPGMGMMIQQCAQCKEILDFRLVRSVARQSLISKPSGIM